MLKYCLNMLSIVIRTRSKSNFGEEGFVSFFTLWSVFRTCQKSDTWWPLPWRIMREAPGQGRAFTSGAFIPWIVLGCDFVFPVLNIYIQFIVHVYSWRMSEHSYRTQFGQCTLHLNMASALFSCFSDKICSIYQAIVLYLVCPEKVLGQTTPSIFRMYLLTFIYMFFQ